MSKRIAEGSSCKGGEKGYLKVSWNGNEQFTYYTNYPPFHWHVNKIVENTPQGQYWVAITYSNTALKFPNYACRQNKFANIYRTEKDDVYCKVKGKILGIIFDKKR